MPAQASSQIDDGFTGTPQSQPLPVFMQDLEFTPMTEAEMAEVRGEFWPAVVIGGALITYAYLNYKWVTDPEWVVNNPAAWELWNLWR